MKKVILIAMIALVTLSIGCTVQHYNPNPGENVESRIKIVEHGDEIPEGSIFGYTPAWCEFPDMYPGAEVSTWTEDYYMLLEKFKIMYYEGDPICFGIYNGQPYEATYVITVVNAPFELNQCNEAGGGWYGQAPDGFLQTVVISDSTVTLESGEMTLIYYSFMLPEDLEYPEMWEFRFDISETGIAVGPGGAVRILITMR